MFMKDIFNITKINTIIKSDSNLQLPDKKIVKYNSNLKYYELIYSISEQSVTHFNGQILHAYPDSILLLPKTDNADYYVERIKRGNCIDVFFDTSEIITNSPKTIKADSIEIKKLFNNLYSVWTSKTESYYIKCMAILYNLIFLIISQKTYLPKEKAELISPAIKYIEENYLLKEFDYKKLSSLCGLSYSYFKRLFIAKNKLSPVKFVTNLKIEHAKELLSTKLYTVSEIATICGYDNVYYFSNVFKKTVGISPEKFKNSLT